MNSRVLSHIVYCNMTYNFSVFPHEKLMYMVLEGPFSSQLLVNMHPKLIEDEQYDSSFNLLVDYRNVVFEVIPEDFLTISKSIQSYKKSFPGKIARVVNDKEAYELFNQLAILECQSGLTSRVFSDIEEAKRWLNGS